jgi:hypothetical protein
MLPGPPGTSEGDFSQFQFAQQATQAIRSGAVKPFVGVFPPLMIAPRRDTECTDVPHGPQAETWLAKDVRTAVLRDVRVTPGASSGQQLAGARAVSVLQSYCCGAGLTTALSSTTPRNDVARWQTSWSRSRTRRRSTHVRVLIPAKRSRLPSPPSRPASALRGPDYRAARRHGNVSATLPARSCLQWASRSSGKWSPVWLRTWSMTARVWMLSARGRRVASVSPAVMRRATSAAW